MVVAIAAPVNPNAGMGPNPRINNGHKIILQIFAIHKISEADFYRSYDYYQSNTTQFKVMLDSMIAQAGRNKNLNMVAPLKAE